MVHGKSEQIDEANPVFEKNNWDLLIFPSTKSMASILNNFVLNIFYNSLIMLTCLLNK